MNSRRILIAIAALAIFSSLLVCAAGAGFVAYYALDDRVSEFFANPSTLFDSNPSPPIDTVETQTPFGADVDLADLFSPVWEARELLKTDFVLQPIDDAILAQGALDGLDELLEDLSVNLSLVDVPNDADSAEDLAEEANTPSEIQDNFLAFFGTWRMAEYANLEDLVSYEELMRAALSGMVASLGDQHTSYLDPEELRQSELSLDGEYEGIGAWVDPTSEYLTIIAPMQGSPAEAAGLLPGDKVVAIDGDDMTGIDGNAVISRILGPAGSIVILTIEREGLDALFDVEIKRSAIFVPSVQSEMLDDEIAYIQLLTFGVSTSAELESALESLLAENPKGLILDLRNNGGGFLITSVEVTSQFVSEGIALYEEFGDGSRDVHEIQPGGIATEIEMVVLVNGGSASASEIVAGAIQDSGRALLVGETTFGKGSVQISPLLSNNQGALRITIAYWLTPSERQIHGLGLEPDVIVELSNADLEANLDPQLEKAIELLSN